MCSCRSSNRSDRPAIPARRRLWCTRFVPAYQRPRSALDGGSGDAGTRAGSPRHGEHVQPGLTQRDMWVMHSTPSGYALPIPGVNHVRISGDDCHGCCLGNWPSGSAPHQPCSRFGAWHTVTHPGHGGAGCTRDDPGSACRIAKCSRTLRSM